MSRPLYVASVVANDRIAAVVQGVADADARSTDDQHRIACAQCDEDGTPRFFVRPFAGLDWERIAAREGEGGIEPETRLFLEMQLESGDLVVDLAPQAGFVALTAATAPAKPHVLALVSSEAQREALVLAADDVDAHIEALLPIEAGSDLVIDRVCERAILPHRVLVHADAAAVMKWGPRFSALTAHIDVLAWCVGGPANAAERAAARALLIDADFVPQQLASADDGIILVDAADDADEYIALHRSVLSEPTTDIFPADTATLTETTASSRAAVAPTAIRTHGGAPEPARVDNVAQQIHGVMSQAPGFHFIAPYCRTGYGISGAYFLRSLLTLGAPVSFFPLGALDRTLIHSKDLDAALDRQDDFDPMLPSVRLSQQFDLALHVGRGPRMGFPIFELNRFSPRARHHLAAQDHLLVCSEWARGVLLENGLWRAPIHVIPLGVDRTVFHERLDRGPARDETVFLQVGKLEPRKGQRELLSAFEAAFTPSDKVRLVLACHNPFLTADAFATATAPFRTSRMASRITLHSKPLANHADVARLMASADCGVFASRAEGWNLEALEMLSCGREVIATDYSAHTAFLTAQNARLIDIDTVEDAPRFSDGNGAWAAWGASQHEQLIEHLRAVHARRRQSPLFENTAGIATAGRLTWDAAANQLLNAVQSAMR